MENSITLDDSCRDITIAYIAGAVEKQIKEARSQECIFEENEKLELEIPGKKYKPCKSTFYLCKIADPLLYEQMKKIEFKYCDLISEIKIDVDDVFKQTKFEELSDKNNFIDLILKKFIRVKATHIAKTITLKEQQKSIRCKLRKQTHFQNQ